MRNLEIDELNEVQGGGIATRWAIKAIASIADVLTLMDVAMRVDYRAMGSSGNVDDLGINAMGDYTDGMSAR